MQFNLSIDLSGSVKSPTPIHDVGKSNVIEYLKALNLDEKTFKALLVKLNQYPSNTMGHFLNNLNHIVEEIRKSDP